MNRLEVLATRHPLRLQLLDVLRDGKRLELGTYARALDLSLPRLDYHAEVLAAAGAISLEGGVATITAAGAELERAG